MRPNLTAIILSVIVRACFAGTPALPPEQRAIVCIERNFDASERKAFGITNSGLVATAWFYRSTRFLVTAEHVTDHMHLAGDKWSNLIIRQCQADGSRKRFAVDQARIAYSFLLQDDGTSVIELKHSFEDAVTLSINHSHLSPNERFECIGYQRDKPTLAKGRFVHYGSPRGKDFLFSSFEYFELRGQNPIALDFGSSGSPVLNEKGEVVAIISRVITRSAYSNSWERLPMPPGSATNIGLPIAALETFKP